MFKTLSQTFIAAGLWEIGAKLAPGITVEINPMFAADVESLKDKISAGTEITETTYFQ